MSSEYVYGIHAVEALLSSQPDAIKSAYASQAESKRMADVLEAVERAGVKIQYVNNARLEALAQVKNHQGIVLQVKAFVAKTDADLKTALQTLSQKAFFLVLDTIQDPHNLGACIRTAEALGLTGIIIPKDKSATITPTVRKVACGAEMGIAIYQVTNLARALDQLKSAGVWVYGTVMDADTTIDKADLNRPIAIVMGNEQKGIRELTRKQCDGFLRIPLSGITQSLNVSVATGIFLFEGMRQRLAHKQ